MIAFIEVTPRWPAASAPIRACSAADRRAQSWNGHIWAAAIFDPGTLAVTLFNGAIGSAVEASVAPMTLAEEALLESFPAAKGVRWEGASYRLWVGEVSTGGVTANEVSRGRVSRFEKDGAAIKLSLDPAGEAGAAKVLDLEYAGTGGAEGSANLKGKLKPWLFGHAQNVEPVLIDEDNSVYQFSGYGPIQSVDALYERGSSFGASVGDHASYAALVAASIPAGRWATCLASGMIRLGAPQYGVITGDVKGDYQGEVQRRHPGAILQRIAAHRSITALDTASLNALDAFAATLPSGGNINLLLSEQTTFIDLARKLAAGFNAQAGFDLMGRLITPRIKFGASSFTIHSQGKREPLVVDFVEADTPPPYKQIVMSGEICWRVHDLANDIAFYAIPTERGVYDDAETYREGDIVVLTDGSRWIYVNPAPTAGNAPPTWPETSNAWWTNLTPPSAAPTDRSPTPPLELNEGTIWIAPDGHPYRFGRRPWTGADGNAWTGADGESWLGSGYEDVQDQLGVQAMAAAEAVTAEVARIASDGWLTAGEKSGLVLSHKAMIENHIALDAKAAALGVAATERTNATNAVNALNAYLTSLSPAWNDTTQDSEAAAATITGLWGDAAQKVALLQAAVQGLPGPQGAPGTNGVDGIDGDDGKLVEFVWKRAASQPAAPTGNGIPAGWSDDPPAGSDPLWMSKAKQELDGTLVAGESWSTPIRHDGAPGISPVSAVAVPASKQFTADSDGVVKAGQLPFNVAIDAIKAGAPIGGTVSVVSVSGCTATAISGGFTIDTISADAGFVQWKIVATDGQEVIGKVSFSRQRDPASGGSVAVNFNSTSWWGSDSYAASGPSTVLPASSTGKLRIAGYASFYSAANGTATLTAKLQYRLVGSGTWIDSGFSATGNAIKTPDLPGEPGENTPGDVSPSGELTGLTADAPYEVQLVGNRSTSGTGIASATGFVAMMQVPT